MGAAALLLSHPAAWAGSNISTGQTALASNLGGSVNADFAGGTLQLDVSNNISRDFTLEDVSTNTIDINGKTLTMSGKFSGSGPITFTDSVGGGNLTLSNSANSYTGATTIAAGATLSLADTGIISTSSGLTDNGTFDISATTSGATITSLGGSGTVKLGAETLTISDGAGTFSGTVTGTGTLTLTAGTLTLSGGATIANSGGLTISTGTLDISATSGSSLTSLSGSGIITLGAQTLTLTNATGVYYGVISGTGGLTLNGGDELLTGTNTFTGTATINGGTLGLGSSTIAYNVVNNGTLEFTPSSSVAMSGVVSGTGTVSNIGSGTTTISAPQTYTGPTTITSGTLALSGTGSIAASSDVDVTGTFDISGTTGTSIRTLSGGGTVNLGAQTLTLTNAADTFSGAISGTGNLVLAAGTETFTGFSTYTGTTTVASGTLIVRPGSSLSRSDVIDNAVFDVSAGSGSVYAGIATVGSLGGNGSVVLGSDTLLLASANDTFSGTISGAGGLTVNSGSETLAGANTYAGVTTIVSGALTLAASGSINPASKIATNGTFDVSATPGTSISFVSLSGSGTVKLGAHSLNLTSASGTFSGTINGTGGLIVTGSETLSGANTYTGGTTITSGSTLQIGNNTSSGSIVGDVANAGTLVFGGSDSIVFSGMISGAGAVVVNGRGTTIFTADNTYTGGTTITAGTLQIGNNGTGGSFLGDVTDNGTLAFAHSGTTAFAVTISGTGGVTQVYGTTVLGAVNSYSGATVIDSGAGLVLAAGGSIATSSGVTDNGTFDVSSAASPQIASLGGSGSVILGSQTLTLTDASDTFSGAISGTGGVTLAAGTETFSGVNTYTGPTTVNSALSVTGSIASSSGVTINSSGTLSGTGTVSAVTVNNGATLAPGAAGSGTLTVSGPVSFAASSDFVVGVTSTSAAKLDVSGAASLAGALTVNSTDGTLPLGQKLTVLTADGGISGTFALTNTTNVGAEVSAALSYDANNVYLEIDLAKLSPLLPSGATANQKNAVAGIDAAITAGDTLPLAYQSLGTVSSATLGTDAAQFAGEVAGDIPRLSDSLFAPFLDAIFDHINDGWSGPAGVVQQGTIDTWASAFASTGRVAGDPTGLGTHQIRSGAAGATAGLGWNLTRGVMLGAAVSAGYGTFDLIDGFGSGKTKALQAAIYGYFRYSPHFYGSFAAAYARNSVTTHRVLTVSGTDDLAGKLTVTTMGGRYETGVYLPWVTPYLAAQGELTRVPAFSETAASGASTFALSYAQHTAKSGSAEVGVRANVDTDFSPRWILTPNGMLHLTGRLAWAHDFLGESSSTAAFTALKSSDFTIYHAMAGKDSALASMGADLAFEGGFSLNAHFETAISRKSQTYTGIAGISYTW